MTGIYCFKNLINNKCYIGQAKDITRRYKEHLKRFNSFEEQSLLHKAMQKYGLENFSFFVVQECSVEELNELEKKFIKIYNSIVPNGYNITLGGYNAAPQKLTIVDVEEITKLLLETTLTNAEIGLKFQISENMISGINTGLYWKRDLDYPIRKKKEKTQEIENTKQINIKNRKVKERPERSELLKLIYEHGFEGTGRLFDVTGGSIKKWCVSYGLPHTKKELCDLYEKENNIIPVQKIQVVKHNRVIQYSLAGEEIQSFNNCSEAARSLVSEEKVASLAVNIGRVCNGYRQTAYNFIWKWGD